MECRNQGECALEQLGEVLVPTPPDWEEPEVKHARYLLRTMGIGDDVHGRDTPVRFVRMLQDLTACALPHDALECTKWKVFDDPADEMIITNAIPFSSVCNHHVLPFVGQVWIGYVPKGKIAGLSKFPRVVQHFARKPQVQERMTREIADFLERQLAPKGIAVVVKAEHMCMTIRGVQAHGTFTTTNSMLGVFGDHSRTAKMEFLTFINGGKS